MVVIIVMAIIFTTGTTVLALTANNYKMRINESKRLQNLYEADSGLDIVKNIIIKTSQEAIKHADKEVKSELIDSTNISKGDMSEDEINNIFKKSFYKFLVSKDKYSTELLRYLILKKQIIASVSDTGVMDIVALKNVPEDKNFNIDITDFKYNEEDLEKIDKITIVVKSTFETVDEDMKNKRTVSTEFNITAPEYKAVVDTINIYPVFDGKAITADGDMNVDLSDKKSSLSISGDIWVKGNSADISYGDPSFTFDKYNSGINLNNAKFNINGNIYTANTFSANNNASAVVDGDIYAQNIYIGKSLYSTVSSGNEVTFKNNVIVNNDLAMNTTYSNITIKNNFYGISDKTGDVADANKALNSSSIIVNESNNSSLTVENDSYILGVAYLNATDSEGKQYQTGESVAVKGNYLAYTDVEGVLNGVNNVTLKYYSPLQLLEGSAETKANYFAQYYAPNTTKKYEYKDGGVKLLGEVKSTGASVKDIDGNIQKASVKPDDITVVNEQRNEYARNVFAMGDTTNLGDGIYENQTVLRTVKDEIIFNVDKNVENVGFPERVLILNNSENQIVISNNKLNGKEISGGLIISNGDIVIEGSFDFTGTIITSGNITFKGSANKNIKYDAGVVRSVIAENYDVLEDIFKEGTSKGKEVKVSSSSEIYNSDNFLKQSLWKIER